MRAVNLQKFLPQVSSVPPFRYILNMCKKIKKSGCNVLLIQKSILRDAFNDLSLHFLAKLDIMVVTDVERSDVDFISRACND